MILFKTLRYKNLLGTGNYLTELDLNSHKTSLIVGVNGAGKSTFLDAITYALYGKSFRNINKPNLINSITCRNLWVEITFDINNRSYRIIRGMKPNIFEIYKDDKLIDQTTGIGDYQAILEKQILKMNFKAFTQIVILGSGSYVPFMKLPAQARREVIEDLLDIQVFSVMNSLLKEKINKNKTDIQEIEYKIDLCQNKIEMNEKHIQALKENNAELVQACQDNINTTKIEIEAEKQDISKYTKQRHDLKKVFSEKMKEQDTIENILQMGKDIEEKIKRLYNETAFYELNNNCPTCKQPINLDFKDNIIKTKLSVIDRLKRGLKDMEKEENARVLLIEEIKSIDSQIDELHTKMTEGKTKINLLEERIKDLTKEIDSYKKKSMKIKADDDLTVSLYDNLNQYTTLRTQLGETKDLYQVSSILLKDGGIKGKIVQQYIPIMNKLINRYLEELDFFVNFELDENFNETIKSRFRDEFSYENFSEGEKVRINLALLFAWMTIAKMRNSASCSLLILDEVLDGSLDIEGTDLFLKLLKPIAEERNVFVISHKGALQDRFNRTIEFKKVKNFSHMVP